METGTPDSSILQKFGYSPIQPLARPLGHLLEAQPRGPGSRALCHPRAWHNPVQRCPWLGGSHLTSAWQMGLWSRLKSWRQAEKLGGAPEIFAKALKWIDTVPVSLAVYYFYHLILLSASFGPSSVNSCQATLNTITVRGQIKLNCIYWTGSNCSLARYQIKMIRFLIAWALEFVTAWNGHCHIINSSLSSRQSTVHQPDVAKATPCTQLDLDQRLSLLTEGAKEERRKFSLLQAIKIGSKRAPCHLSHFSPSYSAHFSSLNALDKYTVDWHFYLQCCSESETTIILKPIQQKQPQTQQPISSGLWPASFFCS